MTWLHVFILLCKEIGSSVTFSRINLFRYYPLDYSQSNQGNGAMAVPQGQCFGAVPCTVLRVGNLILILRVISSLQFCIYLAEIS